MSKVTISPFQRTVQLLKQYHPDQSATEGMIGTRLCRAAQSVGFTGFSELAANVLAVPSRRARSAGSIVPLPNSPTPVAVIVAALTAAANEQFGIGSVSPAAIRSRLERVVADASFGDTAYSAFGDLFAVRQRSAPKSTNQEPEPLLTLRADRIAVIETDWAAVFVCFRYEFASMMEANQMSGTHKKVKIELSDNNGEFTNDKVYTISRVDCEQGSPDNNDTMIVRATVVG